MGAIETPILRALLNNQLKKELQPQFEVELKVKVKLSLCLTN
jgi:hypothetical protein